MLRKTDRGPVLTGVMYNHVIFYLINILYINMSQASTVLSFVPKSEYSLESLDFINTFNTLLLSPSDTSVSSSSISKPKRPRTS
jgi:hypothetical protein